MSNHGYVLHAKANFDGDKLLCEKGAYTNNVLVVVCGDKVSTIRGWDFTHLSTTTDGDLLMTSNGVVYALDQGQSATPRQCSVQTNFNSHKAKTVQFVTFTTRHPVTLRVHFNNSSKTFDVLASNFPQSVFVNATGKNFAFEFASNGQMDVGPLTVDYLLYKGGVAP